MYELFNTYRGHQKNCSRSSRSWVPQEWYMISSHLILGTECLCYQAAPNDSGLDRWSVLLEFERWLDRMGPLQSSHWHCQGRCFLHGYYLKGELVVSLVYSVIPRVIGHKHEGHVRVLISKMGVSDYKNTKFGDMENVTDCPAQGRRLSFLFSFCLFSWN